MQRVLILTILILTIFSCSSDNEANVSLTGVWGLESYTILDLDDDSVLFEWVNDSTYLGFRSFNNTNGQFWIYDDLRYFTYTHTENELTSYPDSILTNSGITFYYSAADSAYMNDGTRLQAVSAAPYTFNIQVFSNELIESFQATEDRGFERRYRRIENSYRDLSEDFLFN